MSEKITIKKKGGETRKIPQRYAPKSLSKEDKKKQLESIKKGTDRPKVKSFQSKSGFRFSI